MVGGPRAVPADGRRRERPLRPPPGDDRRRPRCARSRSWRSASCRSSARWRSGTSWCSCCSTRRARRSSGRRSARSSPTSSAPRAATRSSRRTRSRSRPRQACRLFVGPAIGGLIVATAGPATAFLIDAGTFVFSALMIALIRTPSRGHGTTGVERVRRSARGHRVRALAALDLGDAHRRRRCSRSSTGARSRSCCRTSCATTSAAAPGRSASSLAADGVGSVAGGDRREPARAAAALHARAGARVVGRVAAARSGTALATVRLAAHGPRRRSTALLITTGLVIWSALEQTRVPREHARAGHERRVVRVDRARARLVRAHRPARPRRSAPSTTLIIAGIVPTIVTDRADASASGSRGRTRRRSTTPGTTTTSSSRARRA